MVVLYLILFSFVFVSAEHTGAYSSPQYARKMYPKDINSLPREDKPLIPFNRRVETIDRFDGNNTAAYGRSSFLDSAGDLLSSAGGQMVVSLAKDFIARSTGTSQVLSLNLTNLVILVVLKALILAAGFFGAGTWKGHHYARSIDDNNNVSIISEEEILLYLSYLAGQQNKDFNCLYRLSCEKPRQAGLYSSGAEILLQGVKLMNGNDIDVHQYEEISKGIKEAATWGEKGMPCNKRYQCGETTQLENI